jgi:hypothetical protein
MSKNMSLLAPNAEAFVLSNCDKLKSSSLLQRRKVLVKNPRHAARSGEHHYKWMGMTRPVENVERDTEEGSRLRSSSLTEF